MTTVPYRVRIAHARGAPVAHRFSYRQVMWLVDLDSPAPLPWPLRWLVRIEAPDHLVAPGQTLRSAIEDFLADQGRDVTLGRLRMLTNARTFGYVFSPITVYFCDAPDGSPAALVAEVHNTYGGRHRYLLDLDVDGHAVQPKTFTVSPFLEARGEYGMTFVWNGTALRIGITFTPEGAARPVFSASLDGGPASLWHPAVLLGAVLSPVASRLVMARIRWQGLRLWAKGVPVVDGPGARRTRPSR